MRFGKVVLGCLWFWGAIAYCGATPDAALRSVLDQQVAAWNRGDLQGFVAWYASPCTLVGSTVAETTREQVLAHYQQKYPSADARGKLDFGSVSVHFLDARVATVAGHWHLTRPANAGGPAGGVFSLVFELVDGSWKIALDHTS